MKHAALIYASTAVLVALLSVLGYVWWFSQVRALAADASSLKAQIEAKTQEHSGGAAVRDLRAALVEQEEFVESSFVPEDDIVWFLESLETTGAREGVQVGVVSVSDAENGRIEIALTLRGSFSALMRTLGAIEHGPYASTSKNLTLDTLEEGMWSASYTLIVATP